MCASEPAAGGGQPDPSAAGRHHVAGGPPRRELLLLLFIFATLRLMNAWWFRPAYAEAEGFLFPFAYLQGRDFYPFFHYWLEYPPVLAYLLVGLRALSVGLFGTGAAYPGGAIAWQSACFVRAVQVSSVVWETASLGIIYALARRFRGHRAALVACWVYLGLFATGFVASAYVDAFPVLFLLIGVVLIVYSRPVWAAIALAIGFMAKVFPIALLPAVFKADSRPRWRLLAGGAFLMFVGYCVAPFLVTGRTWLRCSLESSLRRPPWQTVWAMIEGQREFGYVGPALAQRNDAFFKAYGVPDGIRQRLLDMPPTVYSSRMPSPRDPKGNAEANRALLGRSASHSIAFYRVASRFATDLSFIRSAPESGPVRWVYPAAGFVFALFYLFTFWMLPAKMAPERRLAFAAFSIFLFFLYAKGWSPQFVAYLIPVLLIVFPPGRAAVWCLLLTLTTFLEGPIWTILVHPWASMPGGAPPAIVALDTALFQGAIFGRTAIFILVIARLYRRMFRG